MENTTPEIMQPCVDGWNKEIFNCIRELKNIKSSINAHYFNQSQKDSITQSIVQLKTALDDPIFQSERFTHNTQLS